MGKWKQKATTGGGDFESCPAGNHPAVLVGLVDIGTHNDQFPGQPPRDVRKVFLVWEIPGEKKADGTSHFVGRTYASLFSPKAGLRVMVEKWRGKQFGDDEEFDLDKLLGKACLVSLVEKTSAKDNIYAKIDGVSALPKGSPAVKPTVKPVAWQIGDGPIPSDPWLPYVHGVPLKTMVEASPEWKGGGQPVGAGVGVNDEQGGDTIDF
jgi:hypothetical protein